jgi:hypothetical protein
MHPPKLHIPGEPKSADPPVELLTLCDSLTHPLLRRTGITCDSQGNWALLASVPKTTNVPIPALEALCGGFPVVYEAEPDEPLQPYGGGNTNSMPAR